MKNQIFRIACFAFIALLLNGVTAKAQGMFFDTKWENGRIDSNTKFVLRYTGLYEKESMSKYTYDEEGNFLKKEVYAWNKKYVWNDKYGIRLPDYSENSWTPKYCILQKKDLGSDMISVELLLWNDKKKSYDEPVEKIIYQINDSYDRFSYYAFQKDNKYVEWVNNINFDRELLAGLAK